MSEPKTESVLVEAFEVHKELNPKIWDANNTLLPDVKDKILEIVEEFKANVKDMTGMDINPVDIHLLGSNASYNYTSKSDLDVHIVVNFEMIDTNEDLVQALFNLQKSEFNDAYDISIHGVDVELYVEDIKANTVSNGIYSVTNDMWIKEPEPLTDIPEIDIEDKIDEWKTKINDILESNDFKRVSDAIDELYLIRKNGLATTGEYGEENQLFKEIRNLNLLQDLKDKFMELRSKELSLENYKRESTNMHKVHESWYSDFESEYDYSYDDYTYTVEDYDGRFVPLGTNDPREAVGLWFEYCEKYPSNVAIFTAGIENARAFYKAIDEDYVIALYDEYDVPYKLDWMLDSLNRSKQGRIYGWFKEMPDTPDQLSPFSFG